MQLFAQIYKILFNTPNTLIIDVLLIKNLHILLLKRNKINILIKK